MKHFSYFSLSTWCNTSVIHDRDFINSFTDVCCDIPSEFNLFNDSKLMP